MRFTEVSKASETDKTAVQKTYIMDDAQKQTLVYRERQNSFIVTLPTKVQYGTIIDFYRRKKWY